MRGEIIAQRYARAFAKLLGHDPQLGQKHLMALSSVKSLFAVEHARKILVSPVMPLELKKQLLDYALDQGKAEAVVRQFIGTLLESGRSDLIPAIIHAYEVLLDELQGRLKAVLIAAIPLEASDIELIRGQLQATLAKKIDIKTEVDPSLLGGFMVRIGHKLIDLSLKARLNALSNSAAL